MKNAPAVTLVVRRGALRRFDRLKRDTGNVPATVVWDRRLSDRQVSVDKGGEERRSPERRRTPPFTWDAADFVVVTSRSADEDDGEP